MSEIPNRPLRSAMAAVCSLVRTRARRPSNSCTVACIDPAQTKACISMRIQPFTDNVRDRTCSAAYCLTSFLTASIHPQRLLTVKLTSALSYSMLCYCNVAVPLRVTAGRQFRATKKKPPRNGQSFSNSLFLQKH